MIRVKFEDSSESVRQGRKSEIVTMPSVPRIGESVHWDIDHTGFTVKSVLWIINGDDYDVIVRGW